MQLNAIDPQMSELIAKEQQRQNTSLLLIPSENHSSTAVREALASVLTDKYAEGYPGKRYYSGNDIVDRIELLVQERARKLFGAPYVNVQAYSGSPANLAVHVAACRPGETVMGLDLLSGGHLTHGWKHSASSSFWRSVPYHLTPDGTYDFTTIRQLAKKHKPKIIWCGGTALPRQIPFSEFAAIATEVGALLAADISHISGLIVGGQHPSPAPFADIITTTTHKTLRGPRGALIMATEKGLRTQPELPQKIDKAIIPGLQGGPHMNTIAAIGVALLEASRPEFSDYAKTIVANAHALAEALTSYGFDLVTGGTDTHLILVDLAATGPGRGIFLHLALERIGLSTNKNTVPGDPSSPIYPSGLRLGTPAVTSRGMGTKEMLMIADWIKQIADHIHGVQLPADKQERLELIRRFTSKLMDDPFYPALEKQVKQLCQKFPLPE